ncbi:MAG TPA: beta-1,6-N-acetylglucosaminyltransferase [Acidimicrobiales bacterium]|nr:beta-1,6-N-acetylglucosaminyltransferase [Acidimicrobiales bacterium]
MPTGSNGSRVVYVIFSHRRPVQVERLVARILALSPSGQVVLHHDPRVEPMTWKEPPGARVHMVEPRPMDWGGFTMVAATARVLEHVEETFDYDWCAVISGQDYPARNLATWEQELARGGSDYLLSAQEVNFDPRRRRRQLVEDEYYVRYAYRWRPLGRTPKAVVPIANRLANLVGAGPVLLTRPFKGRHRLGVARSTPFGPDWRCFKGSQWMAMSRAAVRHILEVMDSRRDLARYYATTLVPDESFLQSILGNAGHLRRCDQRLTFTLWAGSGAAHPNTLTSTEVPAALASGCAFARKLDIDVDPAALDALDTLDPAALDEGT